MSLNNAECLICLKKIHTINIPNISSLHYFVALFARMATESASEGGFTSSVPMEEGVVSHCCENLVQLLNRYLR